ncbi:uncharacterized protein K441DRAFT_51927 [Cenococcum geophilum 1.58]|uniref:Uncharacterized protein n=1 Tax=Cenococcum geophilum 1.58 TaxID=794803 RepID=A0ACC8EKB8_9PEZI|nr:hypothetical protein K441DRAFT_51927 [Cenococcum geophilum 1.58]
MKLERSKIYMLETYIMSLSLLHVSSEIGELVALTALTSGKRHLDKGLVGAARPPSLLAWASSKYFTL